MLVVEPGHDDPDLEGGLILAAERYLRSRGAKVFYAGGQQPLNPFYWGVYGGSEWSGILSGHTTFLRAILESGYQPVSDERPARGRPEPPRGPRPASPSDSPRGQDRGHR